MTKKKDSILSLLSNVREILVRQFNHPVNNGDIIENALTAFLEKHRDKHVETNNENMDFNTYVQVQEKDSNQRIFLTAEESLRRLVTVAENHSNLCKGRLVSKKITEKGHVPAIRFNCSLEKIIACCGHHHHICLTMSTSSTEELCMDLPAVACYQCTTCGLPREPTLE